MQCPRCKSHSVFIQNGTHVCGVQGCTYTQFHPISFENDIRQYDGQKSAANRYSSLYSNPLDGGGVSVAKEASFQKHFRSGVKMIQDHCHLYKICMRVQSIAEARYASILRIKIGEKEGQKREQTNGNGGTLKDASINNNNTHGNGDALQRNGTAMDKVQITNNDDKPSEVKEEIPKQVNQPKLFTNSNTEKSIASQKIAAYSLYSACFQNELYFEDYNIYHKWLKTTRDDWRKILKQLNNQMSQKIDYVPIEKSWHYTLRVCRKRKIAFPQERAMKIMCQNIAKAAIPHGTRRSTTAACVFWQVCAHSRKYRDTLTLNEICKKSKDKSEPIDQKDQQKYFDCTPDTIKSYFKNYIEKDLCRFLPRFEGIDLSADEIRAYQKQKET